MNILFYSSVFFFSTLLSTATYAEHHFIETKIYWEIQKDSKNFKEPTSHHQHNYSHDTWNNPPIGSSYNHQSHFDRYNAQDFRNYFTNHGYSEKEILNQRCLYMFDEFVKFAQTYSNYTCTIQQLHNELKHLNVAQKAYYIIKGTYCPKLQKRIRFLYNQLSTLKTETPTLSDAFEKRMDVHATAHETYEAQSDHKELVESFIAIDVNQATATILENNNTYESVANGMNDLAKNVFVNAHRCNMSFLPKIKSHVYGSIDAMRIAQDHPTFIFNFSMVHHILGDIQQLAHAILSGSHPILKRSSELLIRGFGKFFNGLNPLTQASNMGHLACDLGSLLKKSGIALWNDPIAVIHNGITSIFTLTELIRNTATFTSDLIVGKLYLSSEEYKQRTDAFCAMMEPLKGITAEQYVDFVAQVAADVVFFKGLGNTYTFLKEIDVLSKFGESAAAVSRTFKKGFDTHLANNPIMITAEGIPIRNFAPKIVNCMEIAGQEANNKKIIELAIKQLPKNQDRLLNVITEFKSIKLQYGDAVFSLDKKGLKHILSRHHPKYWDGSLKAGQSFFSKHTKINNIIEVITKVIEQNRELIITLKNNKQFQITGTVDGIQYVLGTKNGRIAQLYPLLK
jgi:hypothetical protein